MQLKTKAKILYWALTILLIVPGVLLAIAGFIAAYVPFAPFQRFADDVAKNIKSLAYWRNAFVEDWYILRRDGFILYIK